MPPAPKHSRRWLQFGLGTILLWIVPYTAAVAWTLSWPLPDDPTPSDPLIMPLVKGIVILVGTFFWTWVWLIVRHHRRSRLAADSSTASSSRDPWLFVATLLGVTLLMAAVFVGIVKISE